MILLINNRIHILQATGKLNVIVRAKLKALLGSFSSDQ